MQTNQWILLFSDFCRMEIVENPFQVNGELSQKADYILSHSTITRTEIHIEDPDAASEQATQEIIVQESRQTTEAAVPVADGSAEAVVNKPSGHDTVVSPQAVEVEVKKANAAAAEPQRAEEVKLKKRRSCCSVQ